MSKNPRLKLSTWQSLGHYSVMIVPLTLPIFEFLYKLDGKTVVNSFSPIAKMIFVALSLFIGYLKWRELSYHQFNEKRTDKEFENAILASANKLNWEITSFESNNVEAIKRSYGDHYKITIIREENRVLINSIAEPICLTAQDFFINKRNISTFLHYYQHSNKVKDINAKVIQHLKDKEEQIENEPEWNLKNTLKRLIAYLISFGLLGIGYATWKYEGFNFTALIFCLFGLSYIVFDIYVIWSKSRKSTNNKA